MIIIFVLSDESFERVNDAPRTMSSASPYNKSNPSHSPISFRFQTSNPGTGGYINIKHHHTTAAFNPDALLLKQSTRCCRRVPFACSCGPHSPLRLAISVKPLGCAEAVFVFVVVWVWMSVDDFILLMVLMVLGLVVAAAAIVSVLRRV
jgi:hypothetical protein